MLRLDHLTVAAPSLAEGVEHVRMCLDLDIPYGGIHPEMGTHNHVLRLGDDVYLEVIAVDPSAPPPSGPRWFGLGDQDTVRADWEEGKRLRAWVARTENIDAVLADHGDLFGNKIRIGERAGFSLLPDGALPLGGVLPSMIDRAGLSPRATRLDDHGAQLRDFVLEHPSPAEVIAHYKNIGIANAPVVRQGPAVCYAAIIETPSGQKTLH